MYHDDIFPESLDGPKYEKLMASEEFVEEPTAAGTEQTPNVDDDDKLSVEQQSVDAVSSVSDDG